MMNNTCKYNYPIKMKPAYKDYIWGGSRLEKQWGKDTPYRITAESWELSAHKNGQSVAENGTCKGLTLEEIVRGAGKGCLGKKGEKSDRFPILIKLIDAAKNLSVQVHPADEYARKNEGDNGKTEMWYVADATSDASILCGFKEDITKGQFREYIENNTLSRYMNKIPVKKGDVFLILPGTVHAICEGALIVEIQQNSDITYRVYDYDRKGPDGRKRPLHIEKALEVSRTSRDVYDGKPMEKESDTKTLLTSCKYFNVYEYNVENDIDLNADDESFHALVFTEGSGEIVYKGVSYPYKKGDTYFIPAFTGEYSVAGECVFLLSVL